jgi:hypothetical protein
LAKSINHEAPLKDEMEFCSFGKENMSHGGQVEAVLTKAVLSVSLVLDPYLTANPTCGEYAG